MGFSSRRRTACVSMCLVLVASPSSAFALGKSKPVVVSAPIMTPAPMPTPTPSPTPTGTLPVLRPLPDHMYGITIDDVSDLAPQIKALNELPGKAVVRIVFDVPEPPSVYKAAIDAISPRHFIMGELADSVELEKNLSLSAAKKRAADYIKAFGDKVDLWEVGNEMNGSWTGKPSVVAQKIVAMYDEIKKAGGRTAITPYYSGNAASHCWDKPEYEMFTWLDRWIPATMKRQVDYVFVSFYEQQCTDDTGNGEAVRAPDWNDVFKKLGAMFPNSKLGMGEAGVCGPDEVEQGINCSNADTRIAEAVKRYYTMRIDTPNYVSGVFWWYFPSQMIPSSRSGWKALDEVWRSELLASKDLIKSSAAAPKRNRASHRMGGRILIAPPAHK